MEDSADTGDPLSFISYISEFIGEEVLLYSIQSLILLLILLLSGFISALEYSFFSFTQEDPSSYKASKNEVDRRIFFLYLNKKKLALAFSLFKTLLGVVIVITILNYSVAALFSENNPAMANVVFVFSFTTLIFIVNEIIPKIFLAVKPDGFFKRYSFVTYLLYRSTIPFLKILSGVNHFMYGRNKKDIANKPVNLNEEINKKNDFFEENDYDSEAVGAQTQLDVLTVKQIMINRLAISGLEWAMAFNEIIEEIKKNGFSRIPVYKDNLDHIEGVLYVKDLLIHLDGKDQFEWQRLVRKAFFIPESKKIEDLLKDFQEKKVHMAIVVDEYGGTSGLVTLEDIIEEIVGDIDDEYDLSNEINYSILDENTFIFEGETSVMDFLVIQNRSRDLYKWKQHKDKKLGHFILELFSSMPSIGEQVSFYNFEFTVIGIEDGMINRVKVFIKDPKIQESGLAKKQNV